MGRIVRVCGTAALALAGGTACGGRAAEAPRPNVLLITVDTLRADALGPWGDPDGERGIDTPALDSFLADSLVFEHAFATAPITTPSLGSLFTSRMPRNHGALNNAYDLAGAPPTLATVLHDAGYATAAFLPTFLAAKPGFRRGFDVYEHPRVGEPALPGDELVRRALAFVDAHGPDEAPWFVWVHLLEPHSPYAPGDELELKYLGRVDSLRGEPGLGDLAELRHETAGEVDARGRLVDGSRGLYDGEVELTDRFLAPLLERACTAAEPTWAVFAADHGEEFSDTRPYVGHAAWLDDAMLRVPLAFHSNDGAFPAGRRADPASLLDVTPTLLAALGLPFTSLDGGLALLAETAPDDRLLVHETFAPEAYHDKVAARRGARKRVRIAGDDGPIAEGDAGLDAELDAWIEDQTDPETIRRPELDAATIRALEAMGYAQSGR